MREFCGLEMPIFMYDVKGEYVVMTLGEVCISLFVWHDMMADVC